MCSTCTVADNTFNNSASLIICVEMLFEFSESSNNQIAKSLPPAEVSCGRVLTAGT